MGGSKNFRCCGTVAGQNFDFVGYLSSVTGRNDLQNRFTVAGQNFDFAGCLKSVTGRNDLQNRFTVGIWNLFTAV
ncbi:MAG: hypothetical protein GY795_02425 [Desulfobacterales bacterium]|nr:hypothetical protein [Desulfobacterales bacterium]